MNRAISILILALASQALYAEELTLGDLLHRYKQNGYSLIYYTGLVDITESIEWDGQTTIRSLKSVLNKLGFSLNEIDKNKWSIGVLVKAKSADRESSTQNEKHANLQPLDEVVVTASVYEVRSGSNVSPHLIDEVMLDSTPSFGGDSLRVVHRLPGAASLGVSSIPNVRGGAGDELLVLFDGLELIEPFYLRDFQSIFSSLNPQTIQRVEYFTGGFPAQYGNKLSGVLDIGTQDTFSSPGGELGISAFSTSALLYGDLGENQWLFSARRGNLDQILSIVNPDLGDPKYYDIYARYTHQLEKGRIKVSTFNFYDDTKFDSDESSARSEVDNQYLWVEWEYQPNERLFMRTSASIGSVESSRGGEIFAEDGASGSLIDNQDLSVSTLRHRQELNLDSQLKLYYGFYLQRFDMDYKTKLNVNKGIIADILGLPSSLDQDFVKNFSGTAISAFLSAKIQPSDFLTVELGARYDRQNYGLIGTQSQTSPRVSLAYQMNQDWMVRFSYGRFYQPQGIYELKTADLETDFFEPQRSDHWIVATEYILNNNNRLELQLFYKSIGNPKPRYENLFNPYVFIPELESDRISILAEKAISQGFELAFIGSSRTLDWNLNYSYSKAQDRENGRWIDRRWDQPHSLNAMLNWQKGNWMLGIAAAWHTGWGTTELAEEIPVGDAPAISSFRGNARLKNYGTVDVKVNYELPAGTTTIDFFVEITNLLNRVNKGGVEYDYTLEDDTYLLDDANLEPVLPLVGNIGVIWRF